MKLGISQKAILLFVFLVVILVAAIGTYFIRRQNAVLLSEFNERAGMLLSSAALNSEYPILIADKESLDKIGKGILKQKDVIFCEIIDNEGRVIFQGGAEKQSGALKYSSPILTARERQIGAEDLVLGSETKVIEEIGKIFLSFSAGSLMKKMDEAKRAAGLLIILGMVLASFFINLLVRFLLSRPINRLMKGIEVISGGNLSYKVPIKTQDEIGTLAASFNQMTEDLQKTTVSRDELVKEVTVRKKTEEELKNAYEQLKATQLQLVQSAKMASVGQLAGGVAHEINNPLTGVLNNVQLIKMEQKEKGEFNVAEFKELLGVIEESALRCKKITQSLLDFSYASKGVIQPVSLNELVEKVTELIGYEMKRQNIVVQKQFQPDLPKVSGDSQLLQQVIFDLVSNARWAIQEKSGKEGGTITIKTEYEPKSKQVCISISDTGIGIPQENLQRIFEPFFTTKTVGEGTGLGLSIAYNIIKEHKGTIEVESKVNEGSTFRINLPL